ncbi:MAG: hypothetical protein CMK32_09000 [Porticoccaceae bacterium]|nr:hypothetical protein [Porticoccaceae bacterium]
MSENQPLSLDFLALKPAAAARVIQQLDPAEAAQFAARAPARIMAPVIESMESWPAARLVQNVATETAAALLNQMAYRHITALMRQLAADRRRQILDALPAKLARDLQRTLTFAPGTVGAWTDLSSPGYSGALTARECLALIQAKGTPTGIAISIVSDNQEILGLVPLDRLLTADSDTRLDSLIARPIRALPAQLSLTVAAESTLWHHSALLPVRNAQGLFLGTLTRQALAQAMASKPQGAAPDREQDMITHLSQAMASAAIGLVKLATAPGIREKARD